MMMMPGIVWLRVVMVAILRVSVVLTVMWTVVVIVVFGIVVETVVEIVVVDDDKAQGWPIRHGSSRHPYPCRPVASALPRRSSTHACSGGAAPGSMMMTASVSVAPWTSSEEGHAGSSSFPGEAGHTTS